MERLYNLTWVEFLTLINLFLLILQLIVLLQAENRLKKLINDSAAKAEKERKTLLHNLFEVGKGIERLFTQNKRLK